MFYRGLRLVFHTLPLVPYLLNVGSSNAEVKYNFDKKVVCQGFVATQQSTRNQKDKPRRKDHRQDQCLPRTIETSRTGLEMSMSRTSRGESPATFLDALSQAASESLGRTVELQTASGGGYSGGGGASTSAVIDKIYGDKYFVKSAVGRHDMLRAEFLGLKEMSLTNSIKVPKPIAYGTYEPRNQAFAIFEYLEMSAGGSQRELGRQLAQMHRYTSPNGMFGFHVDNTCGATPQPNLPWHKDWASFWDEHRLGHMLKLTGNARMDRAKVELLRSKTRELLSGSHNPQPSLIHGDLWGGNKGFCKKISGDKVTIVPCIFDPATYYGDREADIAMTHLFGGFTSDFYQGYNDEWPLPPGHEKRQTVYNLYHILNHDVLFGGSYINQARGMIDQILRY